MRKLHILWMVFFCLLFSGCSDEFQSQNAYSIYQVNYKKAILETKEYEPESETAAEMIAEMVEIISNREESEGVILPADVKILDYNYVGDILKLNFNSNYRKMVSTDEILCRTAVVKNFVQINGVRYVQFCIEGEDLLDSKGNAVGLMSASTFLEYSGKNITDYQATTLTLYFANEQGDKLVTEQRNVYYTSSSPIEKVIMEQLIQGPKETGHYATVSSNTGILGISVSDRVVYVNLDQRFTEENLTVEEEIPIYSIVNSLIQAGNADKVQISINGDSKIVFRQSMGLDQMYEFNWNLLNEEATEISETEESNE